MFGSGAVSGARAEPGSGVVRRVRAALLVGVLVLVAGCSAPRAARDDAPTWCSDPGSAVVLGDSLSTGRGLPEYDGGGGYVETPHSWTTGLDRMAAQRWGTSTAVLARDGAMVSDFLPGGRWEDTGGAVAMLRDREPSLVVVALGAGEYARDVHPGEFDERYRQLVHDIRRVSPRSTVLHLIGHEPGFRQAEDPSHSWQAYVDVVRILAADTDTHVLDLRPHLPTGGTPDEAGLLQEDDSHLNAAGHRVVRTAVWTHLTTWCDGTES